MFTVLFATSFVFAGNIGRAVYGVYTETYNGVGLYMDSAGTDKVLFDSYNWNFDANYTDDKFEGTKSLKVNNDTYASFYFSSKPQNMYAYTGGRIYFSLKYPDEVAKDKGFIKIEDTTSQKAICFDSDLIVRIDDGHEQLGTSIENDGAWHTYYIALSSFTGLDLNNINCPLIVSSSLSSGDFFLMDNVYWTKAQNEPRAFNVTVKNISNNQTPADDKITWTQAAYRQSWTVAEQYIELDLDQEGSNNWYIRTYLNNGKATRNGLYCVDSDGSEIVLPMAWRISKELMPNSDSTFQISKDAWGWLYDSGKVTPAPDSGGVAYAYPWAYFYDISDDSLILERTIVWDLRGCHCFLYTGQDWNWQSLANYYERKPKIYFAADCSNAIGGLEYEANVVTELVYE